MPAAQGEGGRTLASGGPMQRYVSSVSAMLLLACGGHAAVHAPAPAIPAAARADAAPAPEGAPALATPTSHRGSRGGAAFGDFVRSREPQLQFCYQAARAHNPALAGSATVAVSFSEAGDVTGVAITRRAWSGGSGAE